MQKNTKNGYQNEALCQLNNNITTLAQTGGSVLRKLRKTSCGNKKIRDKLIDPSLKLQVYFQSIFSEYLSYFELLC